MEEIFDRQMRDFWVFRNHRQAAEPCPWRKLLLVSHERDSRPNCIGVTRQYKKPKLCNLTVGMFWNLSWCEGNTALVISSIILSENSTSESWTLNLVSTAINVLLSKIATCSRRRSETMYPIFLNLWISNSVSEWITVSEWMSYIYL